MEAVPEQGKGHAVRAAFALLGDRDVVVLVDGDGTYPAEAAPLLVASVLEEAADMVVGARQPEPGAGAMSPVRGLGNLLIRAAFRLLIGQGTGDLLSGYRAFSPRFLRTVSLRSAGFEIETELAIEAVTRKLRDARGLRPLPAANRRHREQAARLPRRPANPQDHRRARACAATRRG